MNAIEKNSIAFMFKKHFNPGGGGGNLAFQSDVDCTKPECYRKNHWPVIQPVSSVSRLKGCYIHVHIYHVVLPPSTRGPYQVGGGGVHCLWLTDVW